jgi:excisionase family DNA binding protein
LTSHDLLSTTQAAERLGLTPGRIRQLIDAGQLPAIRIGERWVIEARDVERFARQPPGRPHHPRSTH